MEDNAIVKLFQTRQYVRMSAPMVRYSKYLYKIIVFRIAFRTLVRLYIEKNHDFRYDVDVAFTPMILADSFIKSDKARKADFCTDTSKVILFTSDDRPLVVQFGANDGPSLIKAISHISNFCDGVDINCGCPQNWVTDMGMGAKLLSNPQAVEDMIKHARLNFPMLSRSIKIRLLDDLRLSVDLAKRAESCGATFITVHCRTPEKNSAINYEALRLINESIKIPTVVNGDVFQFDQIESVLNTTQSNGLMCGRSLLSNPSFFTGVNKTPVECINEYILLSKKYSTKFLYFKNHLIFMTAQSISKQEKICLSALKTPEEIIHFIRDKYKITSPELN